MIGLLFDLENIATQSSSKTEKALAIMEDIRFMTASGLSPRSKGILEKTMLLNKELTKMMGYKISLIYAERAFFATYIVPSNASDQNSILGNMSSRLNGYKESTGAKVDVNIESDWKDVSESLNQSYTVLKTLLPKGVIKVDLNKATISGLGDTYNQIICTDFRRAVMEFKLTAREMLAIVLHEIGHVFNYFVSLTKGHYNSTILLDTIKNEYISKGKDVRDVLILTTEKITNKKVNPNTSNATLVINIVRELVSTSVNTGNNESEFTSDAFAARFGYGGDLATGLDKMFKVWGYREVELTLPIKASLAVMVLSVIGVIVSLLRMPRIVVVPILTLVASILYAKDKNITTQTKYYGKPGDYDDSRDRLLRIRQQTIQTLKDTTLDNSTIRFIIGQIDLTTEMLGGVTKNRSIADKIITTLSPEKRAIATSYMIDEILNSDLNVASARLRTI